MGQQKEQQLRDPVQKLSRLGELTNVFGYLGMAAGQMPELRHEVRIGQKPDVEDQIRLQRHAVLVAKTDGGNQQVLVRIATLKLLQDVGAQFMDVVTGSIDIDIGQVADGIKQLSLGMNGAHHGFRSTQRMGTPGFGKSPHQGRVGGIEKDHRGRKHFSDLAKDRRKTVEMLTLANVDHQRRTIDLCRLPDQVGKCRDQLQRHIVDRVEAQILKRLERGSLAGAGEAGQDHQLRSHRGDDGCRLLVGFTSAGLGRLNLLCGKRVCVAWGHRSIHESLCMFRANPDLRQT